LCDTPGFMVGPEAEKTAIVAPRRPHVRDRRQLTCRVRASCCGRVTDWRASHDRRGFHASFSKWHGDRRVRGMAWKAMSGSVFARRWKRSPIPRKRENWYKAKVAEMYANGKAVSIASVLEIGPK